MVLYFLLIFATYYLFVALLLIGWRRIKEQKHHTSQPNAHFVSIVIAIRNEEENIAKLLECIEGQHFPKDQFEVLLVDDDSTDDTVSIARHAIAQSGHNINLLQMKYDREMSTAPKKAALAKGIDAAQGSIILTTDGDTWFGPNWISSMTAPLSNDQVHFVSGPVALEENERFFAKVQSLEFASLMGTGAALIGLGYPLMCNGANLAFRKSTYLEVAGYDDNQYDASGDDVYLMQKIHVNKPKSVVFCKQVGATVCTLAQKSFFDFMQQRKRWASKWNRYHLKLSWAIPAFLFILYATFLSAIIVAITIPETRLIISALLIFKIVLDNIFLKSIMAFSKLRFRLEIAIISGLIYPFYALIIGTLVHIGGYAWKGRSYKN